MTDELSRGPIRPGPFCRHLLQALDASEGRSRRRKRDQTPDRIGMDIKRDLMERAAAEDPEPEQFEAWLMEQALRAEAAGPVRAMAIQIFDEYRMARAVPDFARWLEQGAPSDDAAPDARVKSDDEVGEAARQDSP